MESTGKFIKANVFCKHAMQKKNGFKKDLRNFFMFAT